MSEQWISEKLHAATSDPPPAQFSLSAVVERGDAGRRRTRLWRSTATGLVAAVLMVGAGLTGRSVAVPAVHSVAKVGITCDGRSTKADSAVVAASADGVHVVFSPTAGTAVETLAYAAPGSFDLPGAQAGGDDVRSGHQEFVWGVGPGDFDVYCVRGRDKTTPVRITVVDPHRFYRSGSLQDLGCSGNKSVGSMAGVEPIGTTASAALNILVTKFAESSMTTEHLDLGYPESRDQLYGLTGRGELKAVAMVRLDQGVYVAEVYRLC